MKRVLVTGGAGFIGRHLVRKLAEKGCSAVVFDNLNRANRPDDVDFIEGDIRDIEKLCLACAKADTVVHLAAQSSVLRAVNDLNYSFTTNVLGTLNVLLAAQRTGVQRFVFASSREVYGEVQSLPVSEESQLNPKNAYGASKAAGEMYCRIFSDLEVVILRLANVYGPGDRDRVVPLFVGAALRGQPLTLFGSNKILDLVWIGDVVEALWRAIQFPVSGRTLNISSGHATTLPELAERIIALTHSPSKILVAGQRGVEVDRYLAQINTAERLLEYQPKAQHLFGLDEVIEEIRTSEYQSWKL